MSPLAPLSKSAFPPAGSDLSELFGIAFARHGRANDPPGDHLNHRVAAVVKAKPVQGGSECLPYPVQIVGAERAVSP